MHILVSPKLLIVQSVQRLIEPLDQSLVRFFLGLELGDLVLFLLDDLMEFGFLRLEAGLEFLEPSLLLRLLILKFIPLLFRNPSFDLLNLDLQLLLFLLLNLHFDPLRDLISDSLSNLRSNFILDLLSDLAHNLLLHLLMELGPDFLLDLAS